MNISCICPTYSRPELLEEAIESFLRQDFKGEKELIILNDFADQELVFDHPEVRIFNTSERFQTLGEKYNAMFALAKGEFLTPWEDDDIFLPHRLSYAMKKINETGADYHKLPLAYCWHYGHITEITGNLFYCTGTWSKKLLEKTTGCGAVNTAADASLENQLQKHAAEYFLEDNADIENIYYVYRWSGVTCHLSGFGDDPEALTKAQSVLRQNARRGKVELSPKWHADYPKLCRDYLAKHLEKLKLITEEK
jgi:glycosyltransferase involved in cell wall biosynthesis